MSSQSTVIKDCAAKSGAVRSPEEIVASQGRATAAIMQALGIMSCKQATFGGISMFAAGGYTEGCDAIALMAESLDATQRIFQCAMKELSQSDSIQIG